MKRNNLYQQAMTQFFCSESGNGLFYVIADPYLWCDFDDSTYPGLDITGDALLHNSAYFNHIREHFE
jgi:hypothetical protein